MTASGAVFEQQSYQIHRVGPLPPDVDAAKHISDIFASGGAYTTVLLQPGASYSLYSKIWMKEDNQELATEGYPTDFAKQAKLYTRAEHESGAINGLNKANIAVKCIHIVGLRQEMGWLKDGAALIIVGGWDAKDPVIQNCKLEDPRGWSCVHLVDGSQGGRIISNEIGPCGQPPPDGPWADGLSIACRNGLIANNTIIDATDGAIVVFCAPGTTVVGNKIIARSRNLLGGINMVDPFPFEANYTGTKVINNQIMSDGAFVHMAIGIGSTTWGDDHDIQNYGGSVLDNIIGPGRFGYGIAAAGCKDFTVLGNRISEDTVFAGSMQVIPAVSPPCPFLRIDDGWASGTFQAGFVEGPVRYLIGVRDGRGPSLQYHAGNVGLQTGQSIELEKAKIELAQSGQLVVREQTSHGRTLWTSAPTDPRESHQAILKLDRQTGQLTIEDTNRHSQILWDPTRYLREIGYVCRSKDPVLHFSDSVPYIQLTDAGSTLFTSQPEWRTFDLFAGNFIVIEAIETGPAALPRFENLQVTDNASPPTLPPRRVQPTFAFLWLDPQTSQLVLHTSSRPDQPTRDQIVWVSPNWKQCCSKPEEKSKATLQGDGNFVIYGSGHGAVWATGTNGEGMNIDRVAIGTDRGKLRLELRSGREVKWSSS